jgi:ATP-dependent Lon protease
VKKTFVKELDKLHRLNPAAAEYSVQVNYIQTLLDLPWNFYTPDNLDLNNARMVLDNDHFGLEEVKERILEHLAVLKLKGDLKSPILCLYAPGVGKHRWEICSQGLTENMSECHLADFMMRQRSGGTGRPISEQCLAV